MKHILYAIALMFAMVTSVFAQATMYPGYVIQTTPGYVQNQRQCWTEPVPQQYQGQPQQDRSYTGTVVGGIAGALLGSRFGKGSGKTAATVAGAVGGAVVGDMVAGQPQSQPQYQGQPQMRQVCSNQARPVQMYNVVVRDLNNVTDVIVSSPYNLMPGTRVNVINMPNGETVIQ